MEREEIERRALELEPWVNGFAYDGVRYTQGSELGYLLGQAPEDRAKAFFEAFPDARRILELGALEGADTVALAQIASTHVLAVEGRPGNLRRAQFVLEVHGVTNAELRLADVEALDFVSLGWFDAVLCAGLLYHVREPWALIANIGSVADNLFLSTHYWGSGVGLGTRNGLAVKEVREEHPEPQARGLSVNVTWLDRGSLMRTLGDVGFAQVEVLHERASPGVCDIVVVCRKEPART